MIILRLFAQTRMNRKIISRNKMASLRIRKFSYYNDDPSSLGADMPRAHGHPHHPLTGVPLHPGR
jgi:hypothetical protein